MKTAEMMKAALEEILQVDVANVPSPITTTIITIISKSCTPRDHHHPANIALIESPSPCCKSSRNRVFAKPNTFQIYERYDSSLAAWP
jgi:hypothetical protein